MAEAANIKHLVRQGECLSSIADAYGLFWEAIWNCPDNAELKKLRQEPTILSEGDIVWVPLRQGRDESCATDTKHKFRRKGVPARLRLRILKTSETQVEENTSELSEEEQDTVVYEDPDPVEPPMDEPWSNAPYQLDIDGKLFEGETDGDGRLEITIPPKAQKGNLIMEPGTARERYFALALGHLDPVTTVQGVADRLNHLGYGNSRPAEVTPELAESIRLFQRTNGLDISGEADEATQDKLKELHGS